MLGRRNLRVKVMQVLYGAEMDGSSSKGFLENELSRSIDRAISLYLLNLYTATEVMRYALEDAEIRAAKFIKTEEDLRFKPLIAANRLVLYLSNSDEFKELLKVYKVSLLLERETVKSLYREFQQSDELRMYEKLENPSLEADAHLFRYLIGRIFSQNEAYTQMLEEQFVNFHDEQDLLLHIIGKYTEQFEKEGESDFLMNVKNFETEKKFAFDLLSSYLEHAEEFLPEIEKALRNWELERTAAIDLILIKQALCELKYFPIIPVKVTINEYIDISKMYSTPKSKEFVNGVLDRIKNDMLGRGEIKKMGRGLME